MSTPPSRSSSSRAAGPAAPEGEQDKADERRGSARPVGDPHRGKNYKLGAVAPKLGAVAPSSGRSPERRRRSEAGAGGPEPARGPGPEPRAGKTGASPGRGRPGRGTGAAEATAPRHGNARPRVGQCEDGEAGRARAGGRFGTQRQQHEASSGRLPVRDPAPAARQRGERASAGRGSAPQTTHRAGRRARIDGPRRCGQVRRRGKSGAGAARARWQRLRASRGAA